MESPSTTSVVDRWEKLWESSFRPTARKQPDTSPSVVLRRWSRRLLASCGSRQMTSGPNGRTTKAKSPSVFRPQFNELSTYENSGIQSDARATCRGSAFRFSHNLLFSPSTRIGSAHTRPEGLIQDSAEMQRKNKVTDDDRRVSLLTWGENPHS